MACRRHQVTHSSVWKWGHLEKFKSKEEGRRIGCLSAADGLI